MDTSTNLDELRERSFETQTMTSVRRMANINQWRIYTSSLFVIDILVVYMAFKLAYIIRFEAYLQIFQLDVIPPEMLYDRLTLLLPPMWSGMFAISGLYQRQNLVGGTEEYARTFRACSSSILLLIILGFIDPTFIVARGWLISAWLITFLCVGAERFSLRRMIYFLRRRGFFLAPAVIVGANDEGDSLAYQLGLGQSSGLKLIGFLDGKLPQGTSTPSGLRVLGDLSQIDQVLHQYKIEEIILASSAYSARDNLIEIFKKYGTANTLNIRMSSGLYELITTGLTVQELAFVPLVRVNKVRLTGIDSLMKICLDYVLTFLGLIVISPFLLMIATAIKLDSPGPVFHRRKVMGINGRAFKAYKFRTMVVDGDEIINRYPDLKAELQKNGKLKDDPRLTRLGRILRKASLDEFPQLFNVLRLEMSLVGPRMISPEEMGIYSQWGLNLLTVRPGITGLWQVSGRSNISYPDRIRLDMHYIRNWTIWLDLQLLFRTIPAVLARRGAF